MELYEKYLELKQQGLLKPWSEVHRADLFQLFIEEAYPDSMIAELWDVNENAVKKKRYSFGVKLGQVMSKIEFDSLLIKYGGLFKNKIAYAVFEAEENNPHLVAGLRKAIELIGESIDEHSDAYREIAASKS